MMRAVVGMIVGLVLTLPAPLMAQGGAIRGSVADISGSPLPNASITVEGTNLRTTSGTQGDYELRGVPARRQTVRARLNG
jgi:hypothetical protein